MTSSFRGQRASAPDGILPKGCVCGHGHETARGEEIELCLECSCSEKRMRCQNCGGEIEAWPAHDATFHACSRPRLLQIEYAESKAGANTDTTEAAA